jgi:hypothetical protein
MRATGFSVGILLDEPNVCVAFNRPGLVWFALFVW